MSILRALGKCVEVVADNITVDTGLKSISGESKVILNINKKRLSETTQRLREVLEIDMPLERIRHIQLLDEYESATIEGACTTVDRVLSGSNGKSEVMVRQSFAGLQFLLHNDLSEDTILKAWSIITEGCCENQSAGVAGYRTGMVYVGNEVRVIHVPASPEQIPIMM